MNSKGLSGGIGMFWSAEVEVELKNFSLSHIDVLFRKNTRNSMEWRVTGFYGAPRVEDRHHRWRFLRTLFAVNHEAWLCVGDFNEALFYTDQIWGNPQSFAQMEDFRDCLTECGMANLGFSGYPYTWDNKRDGGENIQVRLDRATCNDNFLSMFPETSVDHILTEESDHQALVVKVQAALAAMHPGGQRSFAYEAAWARHEGYEMMVAAAWAAVHTMFTAENSAGVRNLRRQIQALRKGDRPAGEYMQKVKSLADSMAAVGSPLRDDEIIDYMLTGLGSAFNPIAASMNFAGVPVTFPAFYSNVLHYEALQQQQSEVEDWQSSANAASRPAYHDHAGRVPDSGRPSGGRSSAASSPSARRCTCSTTPTRASRTSRCSCCAASCRPTSSRPRKGGSSWRWCSGSARGSPGRGWSS